MRGGKTKRFEKDSSIPADDGGIVAGDDVDGTATAVGAMEGQGKKHPLGEGFYNLESIRKKRTRQGKIQYLIKWQGWPESANTWEPVENLETCLDVIDDFERSQSQKRGPKKQTSYSSPAKGTSPTDTNKKTHPSAPVGDGTNIEKRQSLRLSIAGDKRKAPSGSSQEPNENLGNVEFPNPDIAQSDPSDSRTGAKRRKNNPVTRFIKDPSADATEDVPDVIVRAPGTTFAKEDECSIIEILKPLNLDEPASKYIPDVLELFLVKRSDGKVVAANNGFLKAKYPSMLIDFYERTILDLLKPSSS